MSKDSSQSGAGRDKTFSQKMMLDDPDLKCPIHDRMSIALASPEFCLEMIRAIGLLGDSTPKLRHAFESIRHLGKFDEDAQSYLSFTDDGSEIDSIVQVVGELAFKCECEIEAPLSKGTGQYQSILGFADCLARVKTTANYEHDRYVKRKLKQNRHQPLSGPLSPLSRIVKGHPGKPNNEELCGGEWKKTRESISINEIFLIEAKPYLQNPMETLRQINTYRKFLNFQAILWCPTIQENLKSVFESQGIRVSVTEIP